MMRSKKSTTQKATFSLLSSKEKAGRDCPALLLLKQIVWRFQLEPHIEKDYMEDYQRWKLAFLM